MNKKGFVLVETIFMCIVVVVSLLLVYKSFISVFQIEKERAKYDQVNYLYRTFILRDYLLNSSLADLDNTILGEIKEITCENNSLKTTKAYCSMLFNSSVLDIKKVYITRYNPSLSSNSYNSLPPTVRDYINSIKTNDDGFRLIVQYNDGNLASMSFLLR